MMNAQEVLKDLASSVNIGLKAVAQTIKSLERVVDSTIEEDCIYECQENDEIPVRNPEHIPQVNGCGSMGLHLDKGELPRPEMVDCCNYHDKCYDTCGQDKEECDKKFKKCLYDACDQNKQSMDKLRQKMCKGGAKLLYTATTALGCNSFKEAQSKACVCKPITGPSSKTKFKKNWQEL
ncbi:UNVERIFIED_CONTAM: hypothetical protein GTU68_062341 [Idotea baltica]|nr:hypothetical protein [Idotea baltica]